MPGLGSWQPRPLQGSAALVAQLLPYLPAELLASALPDLEALKASKCQVSTQTGAALFFDVTGFSALARSFTRSDAATAAEELIGHLNEYFLKLMARLHARGCDVLFFAGDAIMAFVPAREGRTLEAAALAAIDAAVDVRAIAFERGGHRLTAHTGVGVGELHVYLLRAGPKAAQSLFAGALVAQVCEAQRASKGDDIVLSDEVVRLLAGTGMQTRPVDLSRAPPARHALHLLAAPPRRDRSPSAGLATGLAAAAPCGCGAALRPEASRAAAALQPHAEILRSLGPSVVAEGGAGAFWAHDIRTVFVVFASFPDLDVVPVGGAEPGPDGEGPARHAARFGRVVRSVHRVADEYGGSVNKIMIDEKGASAILGFGLPGGFSHEDDAERSVRAALALQSWHRETGARFACGVASGRTFCGTLGAPCRKEYALIGDCVILAARLMGAARSAVGAAGDGGTAIASDGSERGNARKQEVLCDASVVSASQGRRLAAISFETLEPVQAKGFGEVPVFRPRTAETSTRRRSAYSSAIGSAMANGRRAEASTHLHPTGLVGREGELARAVAAVEALAAEGRGATLVVEADAGFGKTRFAEEVERACVEKRFLVLRASAGSLEELTPLWALRGILSSAFDVSSAEAVREEAARRGLLPPADASLLWSFLFGDQGTSPELEPPAESDEEADTGAPDQHSYRPRPTWRAPRPPSPSASRRRERAEALHERGRMGAGIGINAVRVANALAKLLGSLEREGASPEAPLGRRIAVFLEDAHWCDSASYFVLRCLRDSCPRLLLVITSRPMADPPRDYRLLSGQLVDEAGRILADKARHASDDERASEKPPSSVAPDAPRADAPILGDARLRVDAGRPLSAGSSHSGGGRAASRRSVSVVHEGRQEHRHPDAAGPASFIRMLRRASEASAHSAGSRADPSSHMAHAQPRPREAAPKLPPIRAAVEVVLVKLGPLPPAEALALLTSLSESMGVRLPQGAEAAVVEKAGGVPLYLVELVRQLQWGGGEAADLALPDSIQQLVLARADRLPAPASAALKLAAVIDQDFTCEAVAAADPTGTSPEGVCAAFRQLRKAKLVVEREYDAAISDHGEEGATPAWMRPDLRFGFLHAVVRDAVYGAMPVALKRDVHARYAAWLEARVPEQDPSVLARHWRAAEQPAKALPHLERAAAQAMRGNALPESRRMYAELVVTIDDLRLAAAAPLPDRLRAAAPPSFARRAVAAEEAVGTEAERERWRVVRAWAIRSWALIEYRVGHIALAGELAVEVVEGLGERLPAKPASPLSILGTLFRLVRLAMRLKAASGPRARPEWTDEDASQKTREALLDCLTLVVWAGFKGHELRGPKSAFGLAVASIVRSAEISHDTPPELLALADVRARAHFITILDLLGLRGTAHASLPWVEDLAFRLPAEHARMVVHNHAVLRLTRAGRFEEAVEAARAAAAAGGADALASDSHFFIVLSLALTGDFAGAEAASEEALSFFSRFGMDESAVSLAGVADGWCAILQGRDAQAQTVVSRALSQVDQSRGKTWPLQTMRLLDAVLRWRRGEVEAAVTEVEHAIAYWRMQVKTLTFMTLPSILIATDFALWWRSYTRARLTSARGSAPQPAWRRLFCLKPRSSIHPSHSHTRPSTGPDGYVHQSATTPLSSTPFVPLSTTPSHRLSNLPASPPSGTIHVHPFSGEEPMPRADTQQRDADLELLQASASRADALAREVLALMKRSHAKRLSCLAPFLDAARAASPDIPYGRRVALLRSSRSAFAESGLRPWEALVCFALSRMEIDPGAAAEAASASTRIATEINLRLPAAERAALGEKPRGWGIVSLWV